LGIPAFLFSIFVDTLTYDQQILQVLTEAGEKGLNVQAISKHVFNMNRTFFVTPDFDEIRTYVQQYLLRNSKSRQSLIESTGQRGYYRLNTSGSTDALQMMLRFRDGQESSTEEEKPQQDLSLSLFD
jgi:hypothetical protein